LVGHGLACTPVSAACAMSASWDVCCLLVRQRASASPIGVDGGPWTKGQISSSIALQLAVALSSPSTANRPRLIRCSTTYERGTIMYSAAGLRTSKNRRTTDDAYSGVMVSG